jgi:hypothetical protein
MLYFAVKLNEIWAPAAPLADQFFFLKCAHLSVALVAILFCVNYMPRNSSASRKFSKFFKLE